MNSTPQSVSSLIGRSTQAYPRNGRGHFHSQYWTRDMGGFPGDISHLKLRQDASNGGILPCPYFLVSFCSSGGLFSVSLAPPALLLGFPESKHLRVSNPSETRRRGLAKPEVVVDHLNPPLGAEKRACLGSLQPQKATACI